MVVIIRRVEVEKAREHRGTGRATLQEVTNFTSVGTVTVSHALGTPKQVSDKLREKIEQAAEELGYILSKTVDALVSGHSHTVAILVSSLADKASSRFMQSLQQVLSKDGFQLLLGCHEYSQLKEAETPMTPLQGNPVALVIFGSRLADKIYQIPEKTNISTTNVVGFLFSPAQIAIETAFFEASYKLTEHLLGQGYKNVGPIGAHTENRLQRQ